MADTTQDDKQPIQPPKPQPPTPQPPMPVNLPTADAENPHSSPLRNDGEDEGIDPNLPPEPGRHINP